MKPYILPFISCLFALPLASTACSGADTVPLAPKTGATTDAMASGPDVVDGEDAGRDSASPASHDGAALPEAGQVESCSAAPALAACQTCCYGSHAGGSVYLVEVTAACECGATGPCESVCASTLCANPVVAADATCTLCVEGNLAGVCAPIVTQCDGNPDCAALLVCLQTCVGKP